MARPNDPPATGDTTRPFGEVLDPPETQLFRGVLPLGTPQDSSPNASMHGTLYDASAPSTPSAPAARPAAAAARRLGPFVVERELARGGMGIVYVARHEQLGRRVALKVLKTGAWADPEEAERFRFEAQAAARLKHPSIVGLHEVGQQDGAWYLAMDLVEGPGSLHAILERDGPLEPRRAAKLVADVARAVHYAHTRSVLHRDIKPHNVLVDAEDAPHLTDFGLAKDIGREEKGMTVTGQVLGTPAYMAPEQALGDPALVDRRSDVYGVGAALYTCLVGHAPFRGHGVMDVLRKVIEEEPVAPSALRPGLDRDLETIVLTAMRKDPAARYTTAELLADDLARWLRGDPIAARRPGRAESLARWMRRHGRGLAVAATGVLLAAGAILTAQVGAARERRLEHEATVQAARAAADAALLDLAAIGSDVPTGKALALGLAAIGAAQRWHVLAGDDDPASAAGVRAAHRSLGQVAFDANQFELAETAFAEAGLTDLVAAVAAKRRAEESKAEESVRATLEEAAGQPYSGVADATQIATIIRHRSPRTLALLLERVAFATAALRRDERLPSTLRNVTALAVASLASMPELDAGCAPTLHAYAMVERELAPRFLALKALSSIDSPQALGLFVEALAAGGVLPPHFQELLQDVDLARVEAETPPALLRRARAKRAVAMTEEQMRGVIDDLSRALAAEPGHLEALIERAEARTALRDFSGANEDLEAALARAPGELELLLVHARISLIRRDVATARASLDRAVASSPAGDVRALLARAELRLRDDLAGALADTTRACELARSSVPALLLHARVLLQDGDPDAALRFVQQAELLDPSSPEPRVVLAHVRFAKGMPDEALAVLNKVIARGAPSADALYLRAQVLSALGDVPAAKRDLDRAVELSPERVDLLLLRSGVKLRLNDAAGAEADLTLGLSLEPDDLVLRRDRGLLRGYRRDRAGALADMEAVLARLPDDPVALGERARMRLEQGDVAGALVDAERALAQDPTQLRSLLARGRARIAQGAVEAGARDLERALELNPGAAGADRLRDEIRRAREGR